MVMNGVPVARPGLILGEDEATPSKKLFKNLPGLPGPVFGPQTATQILAKSIRKNGNDPKVFWGRDPLRPPGVARVMTPTTPGGRRGREIFQNPNILGVTSD